MQDRVSYLLNFSDSATNALPGSVLPPLYGDPSSDYILPVSDTFLNTAETTLTERVLSLTDTLCVLPERMFGLLSEKVGEENIFSLASHQTLFTDSLVFKIIAVAVFAAYCILIFYYRTQLASVFFVLKGQGNTDKLIDEQSSVFDDFLTYCLVLGFFSTGLCILRISDIYLSPALFQWSADWIIVLLPIAASLLAALIWSFQYMVIKLAGTVTLQQGFAAGIVKIKKIVLALLTLTSIPFILMFVFNYGSASRFFFGSVILLFAAALILVAYRTLRLFAEQKISILFWILYLCVVEVFPISLALLAVLKNT